MRKGSGWQQWENHVNEELGLSATAGSGSQFYDKGDGTDRRHPTESDWLFQADAKYTDKGSFSVGKVVDQYVKRASLAGKNFVLAVRLWPETQNRPTDYAVVPFPLFVEMLNRIKEYEDA